MRKLFLSIIVLCSNSLFAQVETSDTITLMTYNVLNFENTPSNNRAQYFNVILNEFTPDLLVVQELIEGSGANLFRDSVMQPIDTNFAMAPFLSSFDTDRCLYYNKSKFDVIDVQRIDTELRDIQQYLVEHKMSGTQFYVFTLHLKASSDEGAQRKREVDSLRAVTDQIDDSIPLIVAGDFNIYNESETGYLALLNPSGSGYFIDPLESSLSSVWNNSSNAAYHTQSTRTRSFGGGSTGGLDDRFDMILYSSAIESGEKMSYLEGSAIPIGNDGNHYNDSINQMPNTSVSFELANALHQASDHLPLQANFIFNWTEMNDTIISSVNDVSRKIIVSPNPADQVLNIRFAKDYELIQLWSLSGQLIKEQSIRYNDLINLTVGDLDNGIYLLQLKGELETKQFKVLIKHQ